MVYPAIVTPDNKKRSGSWDSYPLSSFHASQEKTVIDVSVGQDVKEQGFAIVRDECSKDKYIVRFAGRTQDKHIEWDLKIESKTEAILVADNVPLSFHQRINFVSHIPGGTVTGRLRVGHRDMKIDDLGELDHIWGPVLLPTISWNLVHGFLPSEDCNLYWIHLPESGESYLMMMRQMIQRHNK